MITQDVGLLRLLSALEAERPTWVRSWTGSVGVDPFGDECLFLLVRVAADELWLGATANIQRARAALCEPRWAYLRVALVTESAPDNGERAS